MRIIENGYVFVQTDDIGSRIPYGYKKVTLKEAEQGKIICCSKATCDNPATVLDHYYPYYLSGNRCKEHLNNDIEDYQNNKP